MSTTDGHEDERANGGAEFSPHASDMGQDRKQQDESSPQELTAEYKNPQELSAESNGHQEMNAEQAMRRELPA